MAPNWQLHAPRYQDETNYTVSTLRRAVCSSAMFVSVRTWILNRSHQTSSDLMTKSCNHLNDQWSTFWTFRFFRLYSLTCMYIFAERNQPAQVRSSREGVVWNCSKVVRSTMSQLASHYGFHDLKTWLTWWQSIGLVKLYSSEDKWVPNCPVNPNDSRFCSTFPSTWRE